MASHIPRFIFFFVSVFSTSLHAETESDFILRVKSALESKDMEEIVSLYGNADDLTEQQVSSIRQVYQNKIKWGYEAVVVCPSLEYVANGIPGISKEAINYRKFRPAGWIFLKFVNEKNGSTSSVWSYIKNPDGSLSFASSGVKPIQWQGPDPLQYQIKIKQRNDDVPLPPVVAVTETCGCISYMELTNGNAVLGANRIIDLIIPPTPGSDSIDLEITKDAKPFLKRTLDTSKGAIVPIEPKNSMTLKNQEFQFQRMPSSSQNS